MQVLRAADHRRMAWKNGGGETLEIAVEPPDAGLDGFDWRVSMARIARDGPFSAFPGIDRTLCVLSSGPGIRLTIDGGSETVLTSTAAPFSFAADRAVHAVLIGGPVLDLNVMTRRRTFAHAVRRLTVTSPGVVEPRESVTLVVCQAGALTVADGLLAPCDCALLAPDDGPVAIGSAAGAEALVVTLRRLAGGERA